MSYRFSNVVGKIVNSAPSIAQGLKPVSQETSQIIYSPGVKFPKISSSFVKANKSGHGEVPQFLKDKYRKFQVDDGVPIHIKGGQSDKVLYYLTLGLCAVGVEESFRYYYAAGFPQK